MVCNPTDHEAGLIVSGYWKGTVRNKLDEELGCESLSDRMSFHRLTVSNALTPSHLIVRLPTRSETSISPRRRHVITPLSGPARYQNSLSSNAFPSIA